MTYDQNHTLILSPEQGYNRLATQYHSYHNHLNSFEKGEFLRFLPRDLSDKHIIDIGAGDGRVYKLLKKPIKQFVACDIALDLLNQHPGDKIEKIVCDLEQDLPFKNESFDIVTCFFVLEHIQNLDNLFVHIHRILKPNGTWIIGHFIQRRSFIHQVGKEKFKIQQYKHSLQTLNDIALNIGFDIYTQEIFEKNILLGHNIVYTK